MRAYAMMVTRKGRPGRHHRHLVANQMQEMIRKGGMKKTGFFLLDQWDPVDSGLYACRH